MCMFQTYITHFSDHRFRCCSIGRRCRDTDVQRSRLFCTGLFHSGISNASLFRTGLHHFLLRTVLFRTSLLNREIRKYIYF